MCLMLCFYLFSSLHTLFSCLFSPAHMEHSIRRLNFKSKHMCPKIVCISKTTKLTWIYLLFFLRLLQLNRILCCLSIHLYRISRAPVIICCYSSVQAIAVKLSAQFLVSLTQRERGKRGYKWTHRHQCIYSFVLFNSLLLCSPQISIGSHCKHAGKICDHEKKYDVFVLEKNWNDYKKALIWTHTREEKKTMKKP